MDQQLTIAGTYSVPAISISDPKDGHVPIVTFVFYISVSVLIVNEFSGFEISKSSGGTVSTYDVSSKNGLHIELLNPWCSDYHLQIANCNSCSGLCIRKGLV
jgi:hypothetical protein